MYETSIVFTVIYLFIVKASQEPECFRFDYEEKLLEKMVRMEFKMEQALKRIDVFEEILQRKTKDIQGRFLPQ
ncbi:hypothetical protein DPMN_096621 [Dreissena polymorpha]|uniref:Uncharacterized protein n=1 Tax=Dreissena polymorpha TaxID=45954 RepID=A0A9D4LBE8_DREPO|nr:hypothetical protein DPMN_096621 [Dreissena polymorpha]